MSAPNWRLARSLVTLLDQINDHWPARDKTSDGTVGDARHSVQQSDHNPNAAGIVCAVDVTNDPPHEVHAQVIIEAIRKSRDTRVKYCLIPETRVLAADLTWRSIGSLIAGNQLIGFDEFGSNPQATKNMAGAKMRTATVQTVERLTLPCVEILTDKGKVVSSTDHAWLQAHAYLGTYRRWKLASEFVPGDEIQFFSAPWTAAESFDAGWISGLFDGEGCLSRANNGSSGWNLVVSQKDGDVLDSAREILSSRGIAYSESKSPGTRSFVTSLHVRGGMPKILAFLGMFRPIRMYGKAVVGHIWEGYHIDGKWPVARVLKVTPVGDREVVAVNTDTRTFIAEGMFSHNCIFDHYMLRSYDKPGIPAWTWAPYTGPLPHDHHFHLSVNEQLADDITPWRII